MDQKIRRVTLQRVEHTLPGHSGRRKVSVVLKGRPGGVIVDQERRAEYIQIAEITIRYSNKSVAMAVVLPFHAIQPRHVFLTTKSSTFIQSIFAMASYLEHLECLTREISNSFPGNDILISQIITLVTTCPPTFTYVHDPYTTRITAS